MNNLTEKNTNVSVHFTVDSYSLKIRSSLSVSLKSTSKFSHQSRGVIRMRNRCIYRLSGHSAVATADLLGVGLRSDFIMFL